MLRKIVLTSTGVVTNFAVAQVIHKQIKKMKPEVYIAVEIGHSFESRREAFDHYAKLLGVTIAVAVIASLAANAVTSIVDEIAFPAQTGSY